MKAKVFISCGQSEYDPRELRIAKKVGSIVEQNGFESYLAILKQDSRSFRENIFREIADSEYFLFIDLKRDQLGGNIFDLIRCSKEYRGSLFCHQELVLASYLEIDLAFFQEEGVKREGLGQYIQSNPIKFKDENDLYQKINSFFNPSNRIWSPNWKNRLSLTVSPDSPVIIDITDGKQLKSIWYHILVSNHNPQKDARNCFAFLESCLNKSNGILKTPKTVELHWSGCNLPGVTILPKSNRELAALTTDEDHPNHLFAVSYAISTRFIPAKLSSGDYELTYKVVSDNFAEAKATFLVKFNGTFNGVQEFKLMENKD